jgi:hypothetical protein
MTTQTLESIAAEHRSTLVEDLRRGAVALRFVGENVNVNAEAFRTAERLEDFATLVAAQAGFTGERTR